MVSLSSALCGSLALLLSAGPVHARPYEGPSAIEIPEPPEPVADPEPDPTPAPETTPQPGPLDVLQPLDVEGLNSGQDGDRGYDVVRDSAEAMEARKFTQGGVILVTMAVVLGTGAVIMGLSDPKNLSAGNSGVEAARDRAALTMGIPGALLLAGGIALLSVGSKRKARLRASVVMWRGSVAASATVRF
jgi:hypothetical protein